MSEVKRCMRTVFDCGFTGRQCRRPAKFIASCDDGNDQLVCGRHAVWFRKRPAFTLWSLPLVTLPSSDSAHKEQP